MSIEAMKQALEALEDWNSPLDPQPDEDIITVLRQAIEQLENRRPKLDQGPDYERGFIDGMLNQMQSSVDRAVNAMSRQPEQANVAASDTSQERVDEMQKQRHEQAREPVAWVGEIAEEAQLMLEKPKFSAVALYDTPQQREWVGLTDEQIEYYILHRLGGVATKKNLVNLIRLCESKLKEKNT